MLKRFSSTISMLAVVIASALADTRLFLPISPASRPLPAAAVQAPASVVAMPNTAAGFEFAAGGVALPNAATGFEYVAIEAAPSSTLDGWTFLAFAAGGLALGAAARPAMAMFGVAGEEATVRLMETGKSVAGFVCSLADLSYENS